MTRKYITWCREKEPNKWIVFLAEQDESGQPPEKGITPSGIELGSYASYVEARNAHPDAKITPDAAEAIKYGNI
ncbi:MAG: hypothetical protein RMM17_10455 [Acidobacteriota bacterium]|nr:hypothetical protein [Blastocatellia bacterium]MDW8413091.1 hypothetical protein [Acidobacteriota bacterium]